MDLLLPVRQSVRRSPLERGLARDTSSAVNPSPQAPSSSHASNLPAALASVAMPPFRNEARLRAILKRASCMPAPALWPAATLANPAEAGDRGRTRLFTARIAKGLDFAMPDASHSPAHPSSGGRQLDVAIVGGGLAGLYAIHRLRGMGLKVRAYEAGSAASAAPGSGTAIPARAATSRAWSTPTASPTSCSRNGSGRSATAPSRRSCATSTTSPTASTCAATCSSTPASSRHCSTARPTTGRSRPTAARRSARAIA